MNNELEQSIRSDRHRPEYPALLQPRRPGHPHDRLPQGLLAALQMVRQSREHRARSRNCPTTAKTCTGQGEVRPLPEAPLPGGRLLRGGWRRRQGQVNWDLAGGLRRGHWSRSARPARSTCSAKTDDRRRGAGRGGEGRLLLPQHRWRHDAERRRVHAAAGLHRGTAEGSARARHQYGDRNGVQRALAVHGEGAAPRRHDAARPQADRSRSGTRNGPAWATSASWRTSRKPTRPFPTSTSSPARR